MFTVKRIAAGFAVLAGVAAGAAVPVMTAAAPAVAAVHVNTHEQSPNTWYHT